MENEERKGSFSVGQYVVYPLQGVGMIKEIVTRQFQGKEVEYFVIFFDVADMTVMVPTVKADEVGIRPIVGKAQSQEALKIFTESHKPVTSDWKQRYQSNLELLKKGSIRDIATVVRTLYERSKVKELPVMERKLFDSTRKILIDEMAYSLEKTKKDIEDLIFNKLEEKNSPPEDSGAIKIPTALKSASHKDVEEGFNEDEASFFDKL